MSAKPALVGLLATLLCGVSAPALAAASPAEAARLEAMQRQLDDLRGQLDQLRASNQGDARLAAFQQQLEAMAKDLAELKSAQASDATAIATLQLPATGAATTVTLPNGKPALATADGRFTANIRAILMLDAGKYFQKDGLAAAIVGRDLNEGTNFRRARIGLDGKLFRDFDYAFIYEFGGSGGEDPGRLYEAAITYTAFKPWRIKVGAFEPNIGLAAAVSTSQMPLMERPSPAEIARNVAAGDSRVGAQITGNGVWGEGDTGIALRWFASGALTGNTISTISSAGGATAQPFDEQTGWIGRLAIAPFASAAWQAHFGVNAQWVAQPNDATGGANPRYPVQLRDRPELRLDTTRLIDTGAIDARHVGVVGLEAALTTRNLMLEGEYFRYRIDRRQTTTTPLPDPHFHGWYVQGAWVLTGESRPYNAAEARFDAPKPNYNFAPETGAWGAFEIGARYSLVDLDYRAGVAGAAGPLGFVRGGEQKIGSVSLNWYLNPTIRFMFEYQHVDVDRLNAAGARIGQEYDALAMRGQVSF